MRHEILRIHNRIKATSAFVTHDQHEGMIPADRLVAMNKGTIEQIGTPTDIYDRPDTAYVAGFIGSPAMKLLPGQFSTGPSGLVLVRGVFVPLAGQLADGQMVQLGIRPEHAQLAVPGPGLFDARVEMIEELGVALQLSLRRHSFL